MVQRIRTMSRGDTDPAVATLAQYLARYGYLRPDAGPAGILGEERAFDGPIEEAVARYQRLHGLLVTGAVDEETMRWMNKPRCGVPDPQEPPHTFGFAALANRGFSSRDLRYAADLFSGIPALGADAVHDAIVAAFNTWQDVGILRFQEDVPADIFIRFALGDHGDGDPFDGRPSSGPNVLGHAFKPDHDRLPGHIHLDAAEDWSIDEPPSGNADLPTLLLHEIGHAIGLDHMTDDPGAVMHETVETGESRRGLQPSDVRMLTAIYP